MLCLLFDGLEHRTKCDEKTFCIRNVFFSFLFYSLFIYDWYIFLDNFNTFNFCHDGCILLDIHSLKSQVYNCQSYPIISP